MTLITDILVVAAVGLLAAFAVLAVLVVGYALWCNVVAPVIGRVAGMVDRRLRPITEEDLRRAIIDERAARDSLRPCGSVDDVSTIYIPLGLNGHRETYEGDPRA